MKLHTISLEDLKLLTYFSHGVSNKRSCYYRKGDNANCIFAIFMPAWKLNNSFIMSQIQEILHNFSVSGIHTVYMIQIEGSDDAEDYIVDQLKLTDVPVLLVYESMVDGSLGPGFLRTPQYICAIDNKDGYKNATLLLEEIFLNNKRRSNLLGGQMASFGLSAEAMQSPPSATSPLKFPQNESSRISNTTAIINALFSSELSDYSRADSPGGLTLFIGGDKSQVGKSSVSYGILSTLVDVYGVDPRKLAYIKPVTQCESEQLITQYCQQVGIDCRGIGPVVFYSGFTRSFLRGETDSIDIMKGQVIDSVRDISRGKVLTIIDGVGYPSVGSICGICNGTTANLLRAPVLIVGKSGVGDAVDSFNLNRTYFESFKAQVLGCVFNKFELEGYYSLDSCRESIDSYFDQFLSSYSVYGYIPTVKAAKSQIDHSKNNSRILTRSLTGGDQEVIQSNSMNTSACLDKRYDEECFESQFINIFADNFDIGQLLLDIFDYHVHKSENSMAEEGSLPFEGYKMNIGESNSGLSQGVERYQLHGGVRDEGIGMSASKNNINVKSSILLPSPSLKRNILGTPKESSSNWMITSSAPVDSNNGFNNDANIGNNILTSSSPFISETSTSFTPYSTSRKRTREEIQAEANKLGSCST